MGRQHASSPRGGAFEVSSQLRLPILIAQIGRSVPRIHTHAEWSYVSQNGVIHTEGWYSLFTSLCIHSTFPKVFLDFGAYFDLYWRIRFDIISSDIISRIHKPALQEFPFLAVLVILPGSSTNLDCLPSSELERLPRSRKQFTSCCIFV
jgi:hypothetical protein